MMIAWRSWRGGAAQEVVRPAMPPEEMKSSVRVALEYAERFGPQATDAWLLAGRHAGAERGDHRPADRGLRGGTVERQIERSHLGADVSRPAWAPGVVCVVAGG